MQLNTSGYVEGSISVGGLVGNAISTTVRNSYSKSDVKGIRDDSDQDAIAGGLIGLMSASTVSGSFADSRVYGENDMAGGLVGSAMSGSIINNSYATGSVESSNYAGGIVGSQRMKSQITNSFASATVVAPNAGGVTGLSASGSTLQNVRWDTSKTNTGIGWTDPSSATKTSNVIGLNDGQMKQSSNFSGLDFANSWAIYEGYTSPLLRSFLTPLTVKINASQSQTYSADIAYTGIASIENQQDVLAKLQGTTNYVLTSKNAGTQAVIDNGLYSDQLGYLIKYDTSRSQVQTAKASIAVNGITADNKVYDGSQVAAMKLSNMQSSGIFAADQGSVALNISGTFDTKDVGDNKTVTIAGTTGGANGGNYFITGQTSTTANVTPATYTALNGSKTYDGTNQFSNITLTGVNGETFKVAQATSDGVNVSTHPQNAAKTFVQAEGVSEIAGSLGKTSNYKSLELSQLTSNQANVTPADFKSITGTKDYDGSTSFQQAQVTGVNNETFTTSANANSKNASSNSVDPASRFDRVNGGLVVAEGSTGDLRNYNNFSLDRLSVNQALITPKPLLVNGVTAKDKVYDGSKAVELDTSQALTSTSDVVAGDDVSLKTVTGLFVDKNVGTNKRVDLSQIEFNGASKENYMAAAQQTTTANITPKELVVSGLKAQDKVYDGNQTSQVDTSKPFAPTSGLVANDDVRVSSVIGTFSDKNAAPDKNVALSNTVYNGADKNNYRIVDQQTTTASITPKELVVSGLKAQDKVYDGNQAAQVDTSKPFADNSGLVKNDDVQVSSVTGTFADKNAETNKTVALSKAEYSGADKNNYLITDQKTSTATIKPIAPDPKENNGNITQVVDSTPVTPEPDVDDGNNTQVIHSRPITIDDSEDNLVNNILVVVTTPITPDDPEDNTVAQNLTPDNGSNKTPSDTSNTPVPPRVDNKNNNGNQEGKTDRPVVIPTIKDLQANPLAKINSLPSADAQAVNAATRLSSLEDDYWFLDCFFNSSQELKKIKCEPISQKKSPSLEIKKYPNKKLSALNSPLLP